jgi:hypothetical protein
MITQLRTSILPAFLLLAGSLFAQNQYSVTILGHISPCNPDIAGSEVTITSVQGTQPSITATATLNENCFYSITLEMASNVGWFQVSASCMNGTMDSNTGVYEIPFIGGADTLELNLECANTNVDCLGIPGGPNVPGQPCDDGNPATSMDHWNANCECVGEPTSCIASFDLYEVAPYTMGIINNSTVAGPVTYSWGLPPNSNSNEFDPADIVFPQSNEYQVYGICLEVFGDNCASWMCDTIVVDPNGGLSFGPVYFDCEGTLNGTSVPGSPCDDGNPDTEGDHWTENCDCAGTDPNAVYTVVVQGHMEPCTPAMQGSWVLIQSVNQQPAILDTVYLNENCFYQFTAVVSSPTGAFIVSASCGNGTVDIVDGSYSINALGGTATLTLNLNCGGTTTDCEGVLNGPAMPGTPCDDGNPNTVDDHWTANCNCEGFPVNIGECEAGFWVMQAYDGGTNGSGDPIPFTLWVWNLSTSNATVNEFVWDFGDGTTSNDPYPTHTYSGTGPYILCLSIFTNGNCTDTYCDTVSVDDDGMYSGMIGGGDARSVLTINVQQGAPNAVAENDASDLQLWPNPVAELLNISLGNELIGETRVSITDMHGRLLRTMDRRIMNSAGTITIPVGDLSQGVYMIKIENNGSSTVQRFVKE